MFTGIQQKKVEASDVSASLHMDCPCGSGKPYVKCCKPIIQGDEPASSAEALMRSRFTAYKLKQLDYLKRSWHSRTRPDELSLEDDVRWRSLKIIKCEAGGDSDDTGLVEFVAQCTVRGQPQSLHEASRFQREQGQWRYLDGETPQTLARPAKVGRNAPCPCGSGKKFKKCCGRP